MLYQVHIQKYTYSHSLGSLSKTKLDEAKIVLIHAKDLAEAKFEARAAFPNYEIEKIKLNETNT